MRKILPLCLFVLLVQEVWAQKISGTVKDEEGKSQSGVTVSLFKITDSLKTVKLTATNTSGKYELYPIEPGRYFIEFSKVGFAKRLTPTIILTSMSVEVAPIKLSRMVQQIEQVEVHATRPILEMKPDKIVLNVEGTINEVGNDALELLRKSPGVLLDKDDNITLSGKNGVLVYIDGRQSPLTGTDLTEYLRSLQSSQIDAIEIITNPSARYDAAGNAGIINIRLKKNKSYGTNGSVQAGWGLGVYPKYNGGISLNNRNKFANVYGSANYFNNKNWLQLQFDRQVSDTVFNQSSDIANRNRGFNFKTGADFFLSPNHTFGVMVHGNTSNMEMQNDNTTDIIYKPSTQLTKILNASNNSDNRRDNYNLNLNYRFADSTGKELNVDLDYGLHKYISDQYQPNVYTTPDGLIELNRVIYEMDVNNRIDLVAVKADYEQNMWNGKVTTGGKIAFVDSDNSFKRYDVLSSITRIDTTRSNGFVYNERIFAYYLQYQRALKGVSVQGGLRMEHTETRGRSFPYNQQGNNNNGSQQMTFERNYTDFFPSLGFTFNKNPERVYTLQYSRRIDRPAYQDLNPFEFKIDEYTFQKGNTDLRPQYTNSISLQHTYKYRLNLTLNYSYVSNMFSQLVDTAEISKSFMTKKNLANQQIINFNISYPFQYKNYSLFGNINSFYSINRADFGPGREIELKVFSISAFAQQSLKLKRNWTLEMTTWFTSPSVWQGTFKSKSMGMIDAGFSKSLFKNQGNLRVVVSDIFRMMNWRGVSNFVGQEFIASGQFDSRQLKVNFNWKFGNTGVRAARQRNVGLEEENKRSQSTDGGIGQ